MLVFSFSFFFTKLVNLDGAKSKWIIKNMTRTHQVYLTTYIHFSSNVVQCGICYSISQQVINTQKQYLKIQIKTNSLHDCTSSTSIFGDTNNANVELRSGMSKRWLEKK